MSKIVSAPVTEGQVLRDEGPLKIIQTGQGSATSTRVTKAGDNIKMHYRGTLKDSNDNYVQFDSSYDRGTPLQFTLGTGRVIRGWDVGLLDMRVGDRRTLVIQPSWAYGSQQVGPIPPNSILTFEAELDGFA